MTTAFSTLYSDCNQSQSSQPISMLLHACTQYVIGSVTVSEPRGHHSGCALSIQNLHPYFSYLITIHSIYILFLHASCWLVQPVSVLHLKDWEPFQDWSEVFSMTDFPTYAYRYWMYLLVHVSCGAPDLDAQLCAHRNVWSVKVAAHGSSTLSIIRH